MCASESKAQLVANFNADNVSGCAPLLVVFTDASTGNPTSWDWNFGDGTGNSTLQSPQHNFTDPGQYTVTLTIGAAGSTNSIVKTNYITVFASPVAGFDVVPDTICSGTQVTLTSTSIPGDGAINDYTWTFNDGNPPVSGNASINHVFNNGTQALQVFVPVLLISDVNGCNSTISSSVYVFPAPNAVLGIGSISSCNPPSTVTFTNTSTGTNIYNWDFGDPASGVNNTSTDIAPSHIFNTAGNYTVVLEAGVPGCLSTDSIAVSINPTVASFTASDSTICRFTSVNFTNTSIPTTATLLWNFDDPSSGINNTSTLPNPSHFFTTPRTYTVTLTISNGGCTSSQTMNILVRPSPLTDFTADDLTSCEIPFTVNFTDTVSNIASWLWDFGDGTTSTLQNPSHTYTAFGTPYFNVKLVVVDIYGCSDSVTEFNYILLTPPVVNFTQPDSGCVGSTFNFTPQVNSPANQNISSYIWNFGDGTGNIVGSSASIAHQFNTVGIFNVTLTITTSDGCTATITKPGFIRVGTEPIANFSASPLTICFKDTVFFTDLSTPPPITGWSWSFGDGGGDNEQDNPPYIYNNDTSTIADPFDVMLTVYYNGCPDDTTISDLIVVNGPIPNFAFIIDCNAPLTVPFTNLSGGATSYTWNFGDGSPTETTTNPTHTFPGSGDYNVTLTATSTTSGCTVDSVIPIQIRVPSALITASDTAICKGNSIQFSSAGSVDYTTLQWTFGEGIAGVLDTSTTADTLHLYQRPGYYTVTLSVTDVNGCIVTDSVEVHILGPTAGFTANPRGGCAPINVTFTDTSLTEGGAITSWVWNYGGGLADTTSLTGIVTHSYANPALYTITLTVTDVNGCSSTYIAPNYINPSRPTASIFADTMCRNVNEIFTAGVGAAATPTTFIWDFGDGTSPVSIIGNNTATHSYSANALFPVYLLLIDANGCRDSITRDIFVYTTPADFTISTRDTCVTENGIKKAQVYANFHVDSSLYAVNYNWDLTVTQTPNWGSPDYFFTYNVAPGSYDATLILTNSLGCSDTSTLVGAVVVAGPTGSFSFTPNSGCSPLTVDFTAIASGSSTYAWDFNDGNVIEGSTQLNVSHTYYSPDTLTPQFYLGFQLTNSFCYIPAPTAGQIIVTSDIEADIDSSLICITDGGESSVQVYVDIPTFGPYTYSWNPSGFVTDGTDLAGSEGFNLTTSGVSQYFTVAVGYGTQGCAAFDSVLIDYCPCLDDLDSIPNVFTPNGDNVNDFYEMKSLCYFEQFRIIIFNRWGKKMYESNNPGFKWDGRTDGGTEASEGVYYWIMDTRSGQLHGFLELIRK